MEPEPFQDLLDMVYFSMLITMILLKSMGKLRKPGKYGGIVIAQSFSKHYCNRSQVKFHVDSISCIQFLLWQLIVLDSEDSNKQRNMLSLSNF